MADVSKLQIGSELYNIADGTARSNASAAKTLALQGFKVEFTSPDTITFTQITEE